MTTNLRGLPQSIGLPRALVGVLLMAALAAPAVRAQPSLPDLDPRNPTAFVALAEPLLEGGGKGATLDALSESFLRTRLGHAYTLLDRPQDAEREYELAWLVYQAARETFVCNDSAAAVLRYYQSQVTALPRAYALASEERRRVRSFPEFAAGFARTREVILLELPAVVGREGELDRVSVDVLARDFTPAGETEQRFSGFWRVRQVGTTCALEGAEIGEV